MGQAEELSQTTLPRSTHCAGKTKHFSGAAVN